MTAPQAKAPSKPDYQYNGGYDRQVFLREFAAQFAHSPPYNAAATPDMLVLLGSSCSPTAACASPKRTATSSPCPPQA